MKEHAHARRVRTGHSTPQPQSPFRQGVFGALIPELQRAVAAEGYVTPTPIQEQCIPHLLDGRDLLGTAQTGTGKTAAFALPLLQRLAGDPRRPRKGTPRALILAPTRELAAQIGESIETYGRFLRLSHTVIFGGVSQFHQVKALNRGVDILVATPGRLLDLMQQGFIHLERGGGLHPRRSGPDARHGLHARHQAGAGPDSGRAPDPVLLGHHGPEDAKPWPTPWSATRCG